MVSLGTVKKVTKARKAMHRMGKPKNFVERHFGRSPSAVRAIDELHMTIAVV